MRILDISPQVITGTITAIAATRNFGITQNIEVSHHVRWSPFGVLIVLSVLQEEHPLDQRHHLAGFFPPDESDTNISGGH